MSSAVHIRVNGSSARLEFVLDILFKELLGIDYVLNDNEHRVHINYSQWKIDNCINCTPHHIIYETVLRYDVESEIEIGAWEGIPCFYKTSELSELPYDLFAASFYLLSRYEEYLRKPKDEHRRFNPEHSLLVREGLIEKPLVNLWALQLKAALEAVDPSLQFKPREFEYISTLDIDQAWKFKNKGFKRNFLGFFRDLLKFKQENLFARLPVLLNIKPDPFFNFDYQKKLHRKYGTVVKYFFLLGKYSKYDKNISPQNQKFQNLITDLLHEDQCEVGIHPSYKSNYSQALLNNEIQQLKLLTKERVNISRQHFLKLKLPATYDRLAYYNIKEDYTMGYTSHPGFRAGIAAPFYYFDLTNNKKTRLKLIPFCIMDITPLHYLQLSPVEATELIKRLMDETHAVGGLFSSLWHNESLSETERWKGWSKVYEDMIAYAAKKESEPAKEQATS